MSAAAQLRSDVFAGVTVALVTIPQCMAFAAMAGLPPVMGLYAAIVMTTLTALVASSPQLNIGPSVTISSMVLAVLMLVEPTQPQRWPAIAGLLALLVGATTLLAALLRIGQFVRFVSRSVLVGLTGGVALLIFGTQLAPILGLPSARGATLVASIADAVASPQRINLAAAAVGVGTGVLVLAGRALGPRFPGAFAALVISAVGVELVRAAGHSVSLPSIGAAHLTLPRPLDPLTLPAYGSEVIVGAAAIALVGIIQTLAITRTFDERHGRRSDVKRTLYALGAANLAAGV
ncbi:MAG: SulP family inorganic anion transporter, partial [Planctomycetota bacterium]